MPDRLPAHTDMLIVGGGPADLTLSVTLAQLGIDHIVIDPKPEVATRSKAAAIQPRPLEYLHRVGLADQIDHRRFARWRVSADGHRRRRLDCAGADCHGWMATADCNIRAVELLRG
jgi:2-polyprenyl-6-methoxyphenol hydroxylase-like FAD-dependent oxidoreductase